jgi:hypothetical protein
MTLPKRGAMADLDGDRRLVQIQALSLAALWFGCSELLCLRPLQYSLGVGDELGACRHLEDLQII